MEPIQIEFRYSDEDMAEATEAFNARLRKRGALPDRHRFGRGLAVWLVLIVATAVVIFLANSRPPNGKSPTAPPSSSISVTLVVAAIAPWVFIFGFVWFFVLRQFRPRSLMNAKDFLEKRQGMFADGRCMTWIEPAIRIEYQWEAFHAFDETPGLFLLYTTDPRRAEVLRFHVVPKRAFPEPTSLDDFRRLLIDHVHPHDGAFPVLPPKRAETIVLGEGRIG
jgi:hypothetical protein